MRQRLDHADAFGLRIWSKWKFKCETLTMAGNLVVGADSPPVLNLDCNGSGRNVTLPTEEEGLAFLINNISSGATDLTIKNPAAHEHWHLLAS
jgi:hypothetical protein